MESEILERKPESDPEYQAPLPESSPNGLEAPGDFYKQVSGAEPFEIQGTKKSFHEVGDEIHNQVPEHPLPKTIPLKKRPEEVTKLIGGGLRPGTEFDALNDLANMTDPKKNFDLEKWNDPKATVH